MLEQYHGRAVRLFPDNPLVPFHGAFLDHEMRVRGRWSYLPDFVDRAISLPIQLQDWIVDASIEDGPDSGDSGNNGVGRDGNDHKGDGHKEESDDRDNDLSPTTALKATIPSKCDSNVVYRQSTTSMPQNKNLTEITLRDPPDRKPVRT